MSVELILSHRELALDPQGRATLSLKAAFSTQPPALFALFKVRTNAKDTVDVRPSFGLLHCQNEESTVATMQIKYMGDIDALPRMKLQVSWVWGEGIPQGKLSHAEFSLLYASLKDKIGKEKHHMLQFATSQPTENSQESIRVGQNASEKDANEV